MKTIILLVIEWSCVIYETTACDPGWMQHGDSCYFVEIHNHKHWFGAKRWCESQNGYLAAIANYDENEFLKTQLRRLAPTVHIWLGGTDIAAEHNWVWAYTWEPFGFSDWNTGEPNNAGGQEDCLTYLVGLYLWNDLWCGSELAYICEKPLHPGLLIG
ncbi:perlucin-like [Dreissena polymorpha]|uniref:C-type lectin domain-containing protein n=1 Tax=Dreissena polymorpha TaxID=45954 RepID=A0A9D4F4H1_DREPO|nr:perlucin-like [Dreissena polymorpha]KAH3792175.1 hypothetical protein DPMN_145666 [Dreissena polymorpha]